MMNELQNDIFFFQEHDGFVQMSTHFDIINPITGKKILECRESNPGVFSKLLRFGRHKKNSPFDIGIYTLAGEKIIRLKRGFTLFRSKIDIFDEKGKKIGHIKQHLLSIGGKFDVTKSSGSFSFTVSGNWIGWDYYFKSKNKELAHASKKWAGIGKEFLTTSDNYILEIKNVSPEELELRKLILASTVSIDLVLKV